MDRGQDQGAQKTNARLWKLIDPSFKRQLLFDYNNFLLTQVTLFISTALKTEAVIIKWNGKRFDDCMCIMIFWCWFVSMTMYIYIVIVNIIDWYNWQTWKVRSHESWRLVETINIPTNKIPWWPATNLFIVYTCPHSCPHSIQFPFHHSRSFRFVSITVACTVYRSMFVKYLLKF